MNPADPVAVDNSWRTPAFRSNVTQKIEETIRKSGMPTSKTSGELENHVYQKAKTKDEYLSFVARIILHVREMNKTNQPQQTVTPPTKNSMNVTQAMAQQDGNNQMTHFFVQQGNEQIHAPGYGYTNGFLIPANNAMNPVEDEITSVDPTCRSDMVQKIGNAIQMFGMPPYTTPGEMENHLYQKAKTRDEYLSSIDRMVSFFKDMSMK
ncbi:mediator of RNA polymerase II transcription subunit 15-like [Planococcus citri]|uniref:mediator of RNA polymerase II transcription subunit 15-like n=1 Tax=Planococcus citri TaxID=170843 RepID=UPI0031F78AA7